MAAAGWLWKVCWVLWAAVWTAGWAHNLIRGPKTRRSVGEWPFWMLFGAAWWGLAHAGPGLNRPFLWRTAWALGAGSVLLIAGTAFTLWARAVLGRMWSSAPSVKQGHELRTGGPYAVTRHPIYTGMLAMGLGTVLVLGLLWAAALLLAFAVYVAFKVRVEERLMEETFGQRYADYRQRVPQLLPGGRRVRSR